MVNPLNPHYSLENPATIFDEEAMTALELAARTAAKVNECVEQVNGIPQKIKGDVQAHIEQGTFDKQIDEHTAAIVKQVEDSQNEMEKELRTTTNTLSARLDNLLGTVQEGTSTMDAEIIDARVGRRSQFQAFGSTFRKELNETLMGGLAQVTADNYQTALSSLNDVEANTVYFINRNVTEEMLPGLPYYGFGAVLAVINYDSDVPHGKMLLHVCKKGFSAQYEEGDSDNYSYSGWYTVTPTTNAGSALAQKMVNAKIIIDKTAKTFTLETTNTGALVWSMSSFAFIANMTNRTVSLNTGVSNTFNVLIRNQTELLIQRTTAGILPDDIILATYYLDTSGNIINVIQQVGGSDTESTGSPRSCAIFQKVVCVGDSYTSGHIATDVSTTYTNEPYSWPAFLGKLTGCQYINCGRSGRNVLTWQTDGGCLDEAQATGRVQAYLVGLGLNDCQSSNATYVPIGTAADIGTDAATYYGGLSKIVRELKAISPDAMVFLQTMPANGSTAKATYNEAIRVIAAQYADEYDTHLLDLDAYGDLYNTSVLNADLIKGHFTAIGYQHCAENLCKVWSDYINEHVSAFQNVHLIPYD